MSTITLPPTPETDAFILTNAGLGPTDYQWRQHARRLERERNEARNQLQAMRDELEKVCQQRDAWAMRCDKLGVIAMQEAIREAHDSIKSSPYPDHAVLTKLQPFLP